MSLSNLPRPGVSRAGFVSKAAPVKKEPVSTPTPEKKPEFDRGSNFLGTKGFSKEQCEQIHAQIMESLKNKRAGANAKPDESQPTIKQLVEDLVKDGALYQKINMPPEVLEGLYNIGYQSYHQGAYTKAVHFFRILFIMNPIETKYIFSLGLSLEKDKQFYAAATAYLLNTFLDAANPIPFFRVGVCFLEMKENVVAESMFLKTIELCKNKPDMASVAERARLFVAGIKSSK